ncbi:hypothetical protein GF356_05005 [candidate division GN15 bacterium]|nr:hypothetical protein [candidate division GN15 bacterium]
MWRRVHHLAIFAMFSILACSSSDDGGDGPTGPGEAQQEIQAYVTTSSPATDNVDDPLWDSVAVDTVPLRRSGAIIASIAALPQEFELQAIRTSDKLFLRCRWADPQINVKISPWRVITGDGTATLIRDESEFDFGEDQLLVMFDGAPDGGWDAWRWMAYRTGTVGLAEGLTYRDGSFIKDGGGSHVYHDNPLNSGRPLYLSEEGADFTGDTLYLSEATTDWSGHTTSGWSLGQTIPGYVIDSSTARQMKSDPESRWDIQAAWDYSNGHHTVVLSRELNTGFFAAQDLDMAGLDSVSVRIGMLDDLPDLIPNNSSQQAFTKELILKL